MSFEFIVKADDGDGEAREGGPLSRFSKNDSSKVICIVQVYFLGLAAIVQALILTVIGSTALRKIPRRFWTSWFTVVYWDLHW